MKLQAKVTYIKEPSIGHGRLGTYEKQGARLEWDGADGTRQSIYGTFFGQHLESFKSLGIQPGDLLEVEPVFTTSERNGFVSNYVEFVNPRRA